MGVAKLRPTQGAARPRSPQRWLLLDVDGYARCSAADAQAFEDLFDVEDQAYTWIHVHQADLTQGDPTAYRALWSASGDDDTNGSFLLGIRGTAAGAYRILVRNDGGTTLLDSLNDGPVAHDGAIHLSHYSSTASGLTRDPALSMDGAAFVDLGSTYAGSGLGALDILAAWGDVRGPGPDAENGPAGWCYFAALIAEDLSADRVTLWDAFNDVLANNVHHMHHALDRLREAIEAAVVSTDNIIFMSAFHSHASPIYGDAPTIVGPAYSLPGAQP